MDRTFLALIQDFIDETLPLAEAVADAALELGRRWELGEHATPLFQRVRSDLHTLKGNSAMMGFTPIQQAAHALEDLCSALRDEPGFRGPRTAQLLVDGAEALGAMIGAAAKGEVDSRLSDTMIARVRDHLQAGIAAAGVWGGSTVVTLSGATRVPASGVHELPPEDLESPSGVGILPPGPAAAAVVPPQGAAPAAPAPVEESRAPESISTDSIRVDFHRLDQLLELVGEAVIAQTALVQDSRDIMHAGDSAATERLEVNVTSLGKTLRELKDTLMKTRLVPMQMLFGRFARYVQKLAGERGQPIRFVSAGGDTPIDKTIIDRLGEPLMHIVRNAVAHGVEPADERSAVGKPVEATISLTANYLGERVVISVTDDGRGIDEHAVLSKARSLGMDVGSLSDEDARRLIFSPGFSTAKEVTELSGRGVGLDAVAKAVQNLGGSVDVDSVTGRGSVFSLDLPLTLAVVQGLVFVVDDERFALPMTSVQETMRVDAQTIHRIVQVGVLDLRGELVPVVDAGQMLGTPKRPATRERGYIVLIAAGARRRGLIVDKLIGFQEIVVKLLDEAVGRQNLLTGATILGDGRVAMILDAGGIVQQRVQAPRGPRPGGPSVEEAHE